MTGLVILGLAVLAAAGFGVYRLRTDGRFVRGADHLRDALSDAELGERATLVQFSSAFCAPCRTTRVVLADVAASRPGVRHLEVDAEQHLDLVRALDVRRTPTTLVLDGSGREVVRAAGPPRRDQVLSVLPEEAAR